MSKIILSILALALVGGGTFFIFDQGTSRSVVQQGTSLPTSASPKATNSVLAKGRVVPANSVELRYPESGVGQKLLVQEMLVREGDRVQKGAPLARLDTRGLQLSVEEAKAKVAQDKANYDKLIAGASPEEVAQARTLVTQAQAKFRETKGNVTSQDVVAAQAALQEARATLSQVAAGSKAPQIQAAQSVLDRARADLQSQRDSLSAAKTDAQLKMERAANAVGNQQDDYNRIRAENDSQGRENLDQLSKDREAAALRAVQDAQTALQQATVAYEQAKQAEITGIAAAEAEVRNAQAALNGLLSGADASQVAAARAAVAQAEANLVKLQGDQRGGSLDAASAEAANAQANMARISAPARAVDIAIAQAQIQQSEVALKRAELELEQATLPAPFAGTVMAVNLKVGEAPSLQTPAIVLADTSNWQIETTDLVEQDAVHIQEGDPATITFDALPGVELPGKVTRAKAIGTTTPTNFSITYAAIITPDKQDKRLRWNMTASVAIKLSETTNEAPAEDTSSTESQSSPAKPAVVATAAPATAAPAVRATEAPAIVVPQPTNPAINYVEYTVQKGDILRAIAQQHGISVQDILSINQIANPDSLPVGQVIRIPKK